MSEKRKDYISWDEYFMGVAMLTGMRSKDPNTQVGACIVSADHKILSMGYNGLPRGCSDDEFPWGREGAPLENKYLFTTHSELNAILNRRFMFRYSHAMNVQKQLFRRELRELCTTATSMTERRLLWHPSVC